jgi:uncharacterized protein YqhQ
MNKLDNKPIYGGQAVLEGVMFGGKHCTVTTIKEKMDHSIPMHCQKQAIPC